MADASRPVGRFAERLPHAGRVHTPRFVRFRERVRAAITEFQTRPRHEIDDGARHEHLAALRTRRHATPDVDDQCDARADVMREE